MSTADVQGPEQPAPLAGLPDYLANPNAVLGDTEAQWRYGRPPDYSKTRAVWSQSKKSNHVAGSLPELVENLVKNWEVEASFKTRLSDWRTVDHKNYTFAINGGPPQSGEHMLKVGTYNAIIAPNEYYSPENSDFASSHKTFKRMMPTFAWEVIEVYSGPPRVSFKWRHWGTMKNDYVGFNDKGEKITAKAHGGPIDILGITIATVDDKVRLQAVDTYFDPMDMFRQIAPNGIVNRQVINTIFFATDKAAALDDQESATEDTKAGNGARDAKDEHGMKDVFHDAVADHDPTGAVTTEPDSGSEMLNDTTTQHHQAQMDGAAVTSPHSERVNAGTDRTGACPVKPSLSSSSTENPGSGYAAVSNNSRRHAPYNSSVTGDVKERIDIGQSGKAPDYEAAAGVKDGLEEHLEGPADAVHPHPKPTEQAMKPGTGDAVVAEPESEETILTHEEMSRITPAECPFLMNRE
ncbi:hypothetical protein AAFC00_003661 [Neodothiora populina]|uniref:Pathogen-related protein n=1 Tax=Neodothiora populina TaxID=2781224 RepID=A0ABR3PEX8_9PEZI